MANTSRVRGLFPIQMFDGSPWNGKTSMYYVPSSDSTSIFIGDIVKHGSTSGAAGVFVNGIDCEGIPTVAVCTDGTGTTDTPLGVVVGFLPKQSDPSVLYREASTSRIALVVDDPRVVFEVQEDGLTTPIAAASIGLNITFTTTAGSTVTGMSAMALDSNVLGTTTTTPLRLLRLSKRVDNNLNTGGAGTDLAKFHVLFNQHVFKGVSGF